MATITPVIIKSEKRQDKTWMVKIRISHKSKSVYIDTQYFATAAQLDKSGKIKDHTILDDLNPTLKRYRSDLGKMSSYISTLSALEVRSKLEGEIDQDINFIAFGKSLVESLKERNKAGSARNLNTVLLSLQDYFRSEFVSIREITNNTLLKYREYLKTERKLIRRGSKDNMVTVTAKPMNKAALHNHFRDLRLMFNDAMDFYNDEENKIIRIPHYPFRKFKLDKKPDTRKRNNSIEEIIRIRDSKPTTLRGILARDIYMLSFYLCGMNAVDIYNIKKVPKGRLNYNREKTKDERTDEAFISISIPDEAREILNKYVGKLNYTNHLGFDKALAKGFVYVKEEIGLEQLSLYWARHSFANLARNECGFSKDDIAEALNHVDNGVKVTDIYIAKDWRIVDKVQKGVLDLIRAYNKEV